MKRSEVKNLISLRNTRDGSRTLGLYYFLLFENSTCQVIGECYLYCQRFGEILDFVGHVKSQSVIDDQECDPMFS